MLAELAEVNPYVDLAGLRPDTPVSFIPMADVSESGGWLRRQERRLADVRVGYTPFAEGDVLFAKITPCMENGKGAHAVGLRSRIGFGSTEFHVLRARPPNAPRFIFHWLQTRSARQKAIAYMGGSAGQQRVQAEFFAHFEIPCIGPEDQERIAAVLDAIDALIAKTEAVIAKFKQIRAGLLHDLLTRGIDANGSLRPPPDQAPHLYKGSPLGKIPREWEVRGVLDMPPTGRQAILTGPFGAQLGQSDFRTHGVPVLRIGNVQSGHVDWADVQHVTNEKATELSRFRVRTGDLLFARQGATTGRNALADKRAEGALINYHIIRVAVDHGLCLPVFLHAMFNCEHTLRQVNRDKGRGTREGINTEQIASIRFALPTVGEQQRSVRCLSEWTTCAERESAAMAKLAALKSGLMSDLLTGRVRVTAADETP
jgi:type I restriction enzyme S subunit